MESTMVWCAVIAALAVSSNVVFGIGSAMGDVRNVLLDAGLVQSMMTFFSE